MIDSNCEVYRSSSSKRLRLVSLMHCSEIPECTYLAGMNRPLVQKLLDNNLFCQHFERSLTRVRFFSSIFPEYTRKRYPSYRLAGCQCDLQYLSTHPCVGAE